MADESKIGTIWQDDEVDAIVADYFDMLAADLSVRPYVKSKHSRALMAQIGRTHRSVEFKHQNVSAVLDELGLPWIPGYKPKRNYQNAIFDAIDRYLSKHPGILEAVPLSPATVPSPGAVFVAPPALDASVERIPDGLRHLVRKFDPVERDHRNRALGKAGEEFVVNLERRLLTGLDRSDLALRVRWVAAEDGDGAGYDVLSFDPRDASDCWRSKPQMDRRERRSFCRATSAVSQRNVPPTGVSIAFICFLPGRAFSRSGRRWNMRCILGRRRGGHHS